MQPQLPSISSSYGLDQHSRLQSGHFPSHEARNSPPYQEPPAKLPPISTVSRHHFKIQRETLTNSIDTQVLGGVARPSSPPITPNGSSDPTSPLKRSSQDYTQDMFLNTANKRLKIDSLVDETKNRGMVEMREAPRPSHVNHASVSPRPTLPSFEQTFQPLYCQSQDGNPMISSSRRSSHCYDLIHNGASIARDHYAVSPTEKTHSRSPPPPSDFAGSHTASIGGIWNHHGPPRQPGARVYPASPTTYNGHPALEFRHQPHQGYHHTHYPSPIDDGHTSHYPGYVRNPPASVYPYAESPYQYAWAIPGSADYHGQRRRRGNLPREATNMMKKWFQEHIKSPYPSEEEKIQFCEATGLSMNQVCSITASATPGAQTIANAFLQVGNWFINARRRHPDMRDNRGASNGQSTREGSEEC
jgi:hypothetical protein